MGLCYTKVQQKLLPGTDVKVTSEGRPYLGAVFGTGEYIQSFVDSKVHQWVGELKQLASTARSQAHAAHAALTQRID